MENRRGVDRKHEYPTYRGHREMGRAIVRRMLVVVRKTVVGRPVDPTIADMQKKREAVHRQVKADAMRLWPILDNHVYYSPIHPENGFIEEAILVSKRGRRCAMETHLLGIIFEQEKTRDFERSAKRHGSEGEERIRLKEYPDARAEYHAAMSALRRR